MVAVLSFGQLSVFADKTEAEGTSTPNTTESGTIVVPDADADSLKAVVEKCKNTSAPKLQAKAGAKLGNDGNLVAITSSTLTFHIEDFQNATEGSRKKVVNYFVTQLQNSDVSTQTQQNLFEEMSNYDKNLQALLIPIIFDSTSADLYTAMKWINPILSVLRVILGIAAIILVLLILASTLLDLIYIGIPMARGNSDGNGSDKPFGVSYDAIAVVKEVESSLDGNSRYKNGYLIYARRRALTYFILAICLLYLVVGEIGGLMAWLMSLASGVVG